GAEERAWGVVRAAFEAREPAPRPRRRLAPAVALAAAVAAAGVLASPPGWALVHSIRVAVGVEQAQPELFSLPARGRLLVSFDLDCGCDFWPGPPVISGHFVEPRELQWSDDGQRLLLVARDKLVVFGPRTAKPLAIRVARGIVAASFRPHSHEIALIRGSD